LRILTINCDYGRFLKQLYADNPGLESESYDNQLRARNASLFGVADFYSRGFGSHGHAASEVHVNNPWLQGAWAREHGMAVAAVAAPGADASPEARWIARLRRALVPLARRWISRTLTRDEARILDAQIEAFRPDVILNQEMAYVRSGFLRRHRRAGVRVIGQIAAALPPGERYGAYDLVVSSLPNLVAWFRARGVRAEVNRLAFEPTVLRAVPAPTVRDVAVSFVGSLSPEHRSRVDLLEFLAERCDLQIWGNGIEGLSPRSPLHRCFRGEAWGRAMYGILLRSKITINHHIDLAAGYANNMRLYEATGCGALMLLNATRGLQELFADGAEVVTYRDPQDCLQRVESLLRDDARLSRIALAGQRRTLSEHTYERRTGELAALAAAC
jgi:spore maturation protein CgeB